MTITPITPNISGWLQKELSNTELDYIWECINKKSKFKVNSHLVGDLHASNSLIDESDWFFDNTISDLIIRHKEEFGNEHDGKTLLSHPYVMNTWWVNYQKQGEFNPLHNHSGIYSFVIWLKIPYSCEEQNKENESFSKNRGIFQFSCIDILGNIRFFKYELSKDYEGMMLFFPSELKHQVYPFFDCDEERISVSGNIILDTRYEAIR